MRRAPITPARLAFDSEGLPTAPDYADRYHSRHGALAQARHVFLGGNDLPARWAGRQRFVVLETGFGLGNNFLATWAAWRADPQRCERLVFVSFDKHPLSKADLERVHASSELPELAAELIAAWPLLTPDLHSLDFDRAHVQLLLGFGDAGELLRGLQADVDAFYLDGFAPDRNPEMWSQHLITRLGKLAAPGATAATWCAARPVRDALASAGFAVDRRPGLGSKVHMTTARYAPRFTPPRPAAFAPRCGAGEARDRRAIVIGAGLAGCAATWALARQGWRVTLIDALPEPAQSTSGNPGGLMHPIINVPDSLHSRWFRAAALRTAALARPALQGATPIPGQLDGLIRLSPDLTAERARAQLDALGMPAELVDWLDADAAGTATGLPLQCGAWRFGAAGWLSPAAWCRHLLALAADTADSPDAIRFIGNQPVAAIRRLPATPAAPGDITNNIGNRDDPPSTAPLWHALDARGCSIACAPVLVLANAAGATELLAQVPDLHAAIPPLQHVRGQTTVIQLDQLTPTQRASLHLPCLPISGQGYAIHLDANHLLVGATSQPGDMDPTLRLSDQHENLRRAAAMGIFGEESRHEPPAWAIELPLSGRVGWRMTTPDRLPVVGPPVNMHAIDQARASGKARLDAARLLPRCHTEQGGLYLCTALGSRGIASAALAGKLLSAWVTGSPHPVDADPRDAVDAGRHAAG
jgi:tRNA 5-methylaminomethyl-2-thiouridine biosynthesis bifunctional protein